MGFFKKLITTAALICSMISWVNVAQAEETSTWQKIKSRGELRVGVTQAPPWYYKDPATQKWTGLGAKVGQELAKELGVEFKPVEVTWGTAVPALQAKKIDLMFVLDATPKRALTVDFTAHPFIYYALAVLANDDLTISTWADLNKEDIKIAVAQGTTMDSYITKHLTKATILRFPSNGEAIAAFQSRRVQGVSLFSPPLIAMRKKLGRGQVVMPTPILQTPSSAAVRKETDKTFRDWVNTSITYYYQTGKTQEWYEEFLVSFGVDPKTVPSIRREDWK